MSKQVQLPSVWMIALGVFVVIFVLLMVIGHSFLGALFYALVVAVAAAIFFLLALGRRRREVDVGATAPSAYGSASTAAPLMSSTPPVAAPAAPPTPRPAAPAPAAAPADASVGDRVQPSRLDAARGGNADDLKRIKGVGPKIETLLNSMGFYHLDQIASWGPAEVAWMDENLEDFRGRVSRDDWVGQARHLAVGGDTEFSRRVDEGEVYD